MSEKYKRDIDELERHSVKWWPKELIAGSADISIIPTLLDTQDDFISLLQLCDKEPLQIFDLIKAAKFPANYFLKHLVILADYGGEPIQRLNTNFRDVFGDPCDDTGKYCLKSSFKGNPFSYNFLEIPISGKLSNSKLGIDAKGMTSKKEMDDLKKDMIMILLYGSNATNVSGGGMEKWEIGNYLGKGEKLERYIKQKYILVSRITGGATANAQGQLAQQFVFKYLRNSLGNDYELVSNGAIKLDGYSGKTGMPFDLVVAKGGKKVGVEVSFQVTTNSTIERKRGQAQERISLMHNMGYKIAYVIDGAGNFQRRSAISQICAQSDCTVAFSNDEFEVLSKFIKENLEEI